VVAEITFEFVESPIELVATIYTLYDVLIANPEMVNGLVVVEAFTNAPLFSEYLYVVMDDPPSDAGGVKATVNC
jgi:hypothetical protein